VEPRLQRRYQQLVLEHLRVSDPLAAGIHALAVSGLADGFAAVLGAHRFFYNDRADVPALAQPLQQLARDWRRQAPDTWALSIHDWSTLSYHAHTRKTDQAQLTNKRSKGYERTTLLLVEGQAGHPIAPLEVRLRAAKAVHSTRTPAPAATAFRIDEVLPSMQAVRAMGLSGPVVHVIDREADGLAHYRAWQKAGHHFLVRAKGGRIVRYQDEEVSLSNLAQRLTCRRCRDITSKGQTAVQHVAAAEVVLDRPGWRQRRAAGQRLVNERVPGEPIALRLVAAMACALVWRLERLETVAGATLRQLLVRLSGRRRARGREFTAPALLAGLWSLLAMLEVLQEHRVEELRGYRDLLLGKAEEDPG
jgi:hypothetical protein